MHPVLYHSIRALHAVCIEYASPREEAFGNFKLAGRGSIRRPPSVISWVVCPKNLQRQGELDEGQVIKHRNRQASRQMQIAGAKAQCVKNLLTLMDEPALQVILDAVSEWGWEGAPFSEECLATKRIYPGRHFRATSKAWTDRQAVTRSDFSTVIPQRRATSTVRRVCRST